MKDRIYGLLCLALAAVTFAMAESHMPEPARGVIFVLGLLLAGYGLTGVLPIRIRRSAHLISYVEVRMDNDHKVVSLLPGKIVTDAGATTALHRVEDRTVRYSPNGYSQFLIISAVKISAREYEAEVKRSAMSDPTYKVLFPEDEDGA